MFLFKTIQIGNICILSHKTARRVVEMGLVWTNLLSFLGGMLMTGKRYNANINISFENGCRTLPSILWTC